MNDAEFERLRGRLNEVNKICGELLKLNPGEFTPEQENKLKELLQPYSEFYEAFKKGVSERGMGLS
jgi:hypothetical protein